MSLTIWKYDLWGATSLKARDIANMQLPVGAVILTVRAQEGRPKIWAIVDPEGTTTFENRRFVIVGTGERMPGWDTHTQYVGTFQIPSLGGGEFVGHVFELLEQEA